MGRNRDPFSVLNVKKAVRARDGACTECGMTNDQHIAEFGHQLHVHRKIRGRRYRAEECVALCRPCHFGGHGESGDKLVKVQYEAGVKCPATLIFTKEADIAVRDAAAKCGTSVRGFITENAMRAAQRILESAHASRR